MSDEASTTSWDVDEVRGTHESDEHWELRKSFLLRHQADLPKLRLLCLSQVFVNVEFLGCRYPEETMTLVADMSAGLTEEYRQSRQGKLKRTFVKASDAAEKKSKGIKRSHSPSPSPSSAVTPPKRPINDDAHVRGLEDLVLVEHVFNQTEGPFAVLHRSSGMCHKKLTIDYSSTEDTKICNLSIEPSFKVVGQGSTKELARLDAASQAMTKLRQSCYTIQVLENILSATTEIGKEDLQSKAQADVSQDSNKLQSESNIGNRLLRLMGWTGGGLGKDEKGIETPIEVDTVHRGRIGLGMVEGGREFRPAIEKFLKSEMQHCEKGDLQFSAEFSMEERKIIHNVAWKLGLKSHSHGKGSSRFLVVSRKIKPIDLVFEILTLGTHPKYRVVPPGLGVIK